MGGEVPGGDRLLAAQLVTAVGIFCLCARDPACDLHEEHHRGIYYVNLRFHRGLRKVTKTKGAFASDEALLKLLYLVQEEITSKWKRPIHN